MGLKKSAISLCMIVRDEEKNLDRCLRSVRDYVDEVIIVDTGSVDSTPEIAKGYAARVVFLPWPKDFSQARNESLKYATKDWILVLDGDEELPAQTACDLKKLARAEDIEGWTFAIVSPESSTREGRQQEHLSLRMFRNKKEYRFAGRIHEQINPVLGPKNGEAIQYANLRIMHYGYTNDDGERRRKMLRNMAILQEALAENPQEPFLHYSLGVSYFALGDLDKSQSHYEAALRNLDAGAGFAADLYRNYNLCLYEMGDYARVLQLSEQGLGYFPDYPDLYFIKGMAFFDLDMLPQARANFFKCTCFRQLIPNHVTTQGVTGHLALENLAGVYAREENFDEAVRCLTLALKEKPFPRLFSRLCSWLQKLNYQGQEVAVFLEDNFELDWSQMVHLLFGLGEFSACLAYLDRKHPAIPEALTWRIKCLLSLGRLDAVPEAFRLHSSGLPVPEEALKLGCVAQWLQNPGQDAKDLLFTFGKQGSPVFYACQLANDLITGLHHEYSGQSLPDDVLEHLLGMAWEIFSLGNKDLALAVAALVSGRGNKGQAYFNLAKYALKQGCDREAGMLLERALAGHKPVKEVYFLLGTALANLNLPKKAFHCFLQASRQEPENELYAVCALEQLACQCFLLVSDGLKLERENAALRQELLKTASLKKKMSRMRRLLTGQDQHRSSFLIASLTEDRQECTI